MKMWDLRKQKAVYTVPAHKNVIPDIRFDASGEFLVSGGFDRTVKGRRGGGGARSSVVDAKFSVREDIGGA